MRILKALLLSAVLLVLAGAGAHAMTFGPVDFGIAGDYTVLSLSGEFSLSNSQTTVHGDIALGGGKQNFSDATIYGTYYVDPNANNGKSNNVLFEGGTTALDLSGAVSAVHSAAITASALAVDQSFAEIKDPSVIQSTGSLNVVEAGKIKLDGGETLTLVGAPGDVFIVNASDLSLTGDAIVVLEGGLTADSVLFNLSNEYVQSGSSVVNGTVICSSSIGCSKRGRNSGGTLNGALFAEGIDLTSAAQINRVASAPVPEPGAALLFGLGAVAVRSRSRIHR